MERKFEEVVETIRNAEADVDKVLDAARLERHEGPPRYLSAEQKMNIIYCSFGLLAFLGFLGFMIVPFFA